MGHGTTEHFTRDLSLVVESYHLMKRAVISVYDKTGVVELAKVLHNAGVELVSTGGTASVLAAAGLPVVQVSQLTGFPEMLEGRVKTLHPKLFGGILARRDKPQHMKDLAAQGIGAIDMVVVNLYPFVQTVQKPNVSLEEALENIDIGGPALLRAAAKNFPSVVVVVDPSDYSWVAEKVHSDSFTTEERLWLAGKAFHHVAVYDAAVAEYLSQVNIGTLPATVPVGLHKLAELRYGENPHQKGAVYTTALGRGGIAHARQLSGPELSYNNLLDADAAWEVVNDFTEPTVAVIKHVNPCGLASHDDLAEAYRLAYEGDTVSAYGGIVGCNRTVTAAMAEAMRGVLYHVIVAPGYEPRTLEVFAKRKQLRVLQVEPTQGQMEFLAMRPISGGVLVQTKDILKEEPKTWRVATSRTPTPEEMEGLVFAWKAVKHVRSNAIVLVSGKKLVGMGTGQPNRVTSVKLAIEVAGERAKGSVLASDAFFPFADNVEVASQAGVTAIVQPGGSVRDQECIDAANKHGIAMLFTGVRHFKH